MDEKSVKKKKQHGSGWKQRMGRRQLAMAQDKNRTRSERGPRGILFAVCLLSHLENRSSLIPHPFDEALQWGWQDGKSRSAVPPVSLWRRHLSSG